MATADELLAMMAEDGTVYDDDICFADQDTRTVAIPERLKIIGVENDDDVAVRRFRVPAICCGTDLSAFEIRVNFENAKKERDCYFVTDAVVDGDCITFSWRVDRAALRYKGRLRFAIHMELLDADGFIEKEWNSAPAHFDVLEGLEVELTGKEEEAARAAATQLVVLLEKEGENQIAAVEAAGAEMIASIPEDYVALNDHVDVLDAEALNRISEMEKYVKYEVGDNLFDPTNVIKGMRFRVDIGANTGKLEERSNAFAAYVRITGPGVYRLKVSSGLYGTAVSRINVYDARKRYIETMTGTVTDNILTLEITNEAVHYIGYSHYLTQLDIVIKPMIVKNREYPSNYIEYVGGYVLDEDAIGVGTYPGHVQSAWEQRMLDRIDLALIPMPALRKMAKAPTGYVNEGEMITGVVYSALNGQKDEAGNVIEEPRRVGTEISFSTYYSALANPASVMYTEDKYQDDTYFDSYKSRSTYYGTNCSGFVSWAFGWKAWRGTMGMASEYKDKLLDITTEDDLFQIRRGDLILNSVIVPVGEDGNPDTSANHVKLVKDVLYDRATGRLVGFNVAEGTRPFARVSFMDLPTFLAQLDPTKKQPYFVARIPDADYGLDVPEIKYSQAVYPDRGDGGKYASGEAVQLYIPDATASSITYTMGEQSVTMALSDMESAIVNDVTVYNLTGLAAGEYTISTDAAPDDPCTIIVTA